jgi:hypothetical protein
MPHEHWWRVDEIKPIVNRSELTTFEITHALAYQFFQAKVSTPRD